MSRPGPTPPLTPPPTSDRARSCSPGNALPETIEVLLSQDAIKCQDNESYRDGYEASDTDVYIAVMGQTGSGKSSFINWLSERKANVSDEIESCTQKIDVYRHRFTTRNVFLVDTPGFNDSWRDDVEILHEVADWLGNSFRNGIKLSGVLFLHSITQNRFTQSAKHMVRTFDEIVGTGDKFEECMKNVVLVTTMWDSCNLDEQKKLHERHEYFVRDPNFWGKFNSRGARDAKHTNTQESALEIIRILIPEDDLDVFRMTLGIQEELVNDRLPLSQTSAGNYQFNVLEDVKRKCRDKVRELEKDISLEPHPIRRRELEEDQIESELISQKITEKQEALESVVIDENSKPKLAYVYAKSVCSNLEQDQRSFGTVEIVTDNYGNETKSYDNATVKFLKAGLAPGNTSFQTIAREPLYSIADISDSESDESLVGAIQENDPVAKDVAQNPRKLRRASTSIDIPRSQANLDLFAACRNASLDEFNAVITNYTKDSRLRLVKHRDSKGNTLLHEVFARQNNLLEALDILLPRFRSTDIASTNNEGYTPLHFAVSIGNVQCVKRIIGPISTRDISQSTRAGWTPIAIAIVNGFSEIIEILASDHEDGRPVVSGQALDTLMAYPAETVRRFFNVCKSACSGFWRAKGPLGRTFLHSAMYTNISTARVCFEAANQAPEEDRDYLLTACDSRGMSAIATAAALGLTEHIREFFAVFGSVKRRRDLLNIKTSVGSPYFLAQSRGHGDTAQALIVSGAGPDRHDTEFCGLSAEEWSASIRGRNVLRRSNLNPFGRHATVHETREFENLKRSVKKRQYHETVSILDNDRECLASDIERLFILAYHYFGLFHKRTYRYDSGSRDYCHRADESYSDPSGLDVGTNLYALATHLCDARTGRSESLCDSCLRPFQERFYVCTCCPFAQYCTHCNRRLREGFKTRMKHSKCPGPVEHVWVRIDFSKYNFRQPGYILVGHRIDQYLDRITEDLRQWGKKKNFL